MPIPQSKSPILSICIPAYRNEEGVRRILSTLGDGSNLEILISEDKSDSPLDLRDLHKRLQFEHYVNERPKGAVSNWNRVISRAHGKYIWLLHHDEEPVFEGGVSRFLDNLTNGPERDCLVSSLKLDDRVWQRSLRTNPIRKMLVNFPMTVLLHNYIGSPSNVIFHRRVIEKFDERLQWLVDCEWYFRLFANCDEVTFGEFGILSHPYSESITMNLGREVSTLALNEARFVCEKHNVSRLATRLWLIKLSIVKALR